MNSVPVRLTRMDTGCRACGPHQFSKNPSTVPFSRRCRATWNCPWCANAGGCTGRRKRCAAPLARWFALLGAQKRGLGIRLFPRFAAGGTGRAASQRHSLFATSLLRMAELSRPMGALYYKSAIEASIPFESSAISTDEPPHLKGPNGMDLVPEVRRTPAGTSLLLHRQDLPDGPSTSSPMERIPCKASH